MIPRRRLRIKAESMRPSDWRVWIDDLEITTSLTGVSVTWSVDDIPQAELHMLLDGVDIDAETLMVLQAHVEAKA